MKISKILLLGLLAIPACTGRASCRGKTESLPPAADAAPNEADACPMPDAAPVPMPDASL